jgi:hypothetical protein
MSPCVGVSLRSFWTLWLSSKQEQIINDKLAVNFVAIAKPQEREKQKSVAKI